jgi:hypothetical protein
MTECPRLSVMVTFASGSDWAKRPTWYAAINRTGESFKATEQVEDLPSRRAGDRVAAGPRHRRRGVGPMTSDAEWVELADLRCPGCREQVNPELPAAEAGEFWSHRDGSPLCGMGTGGPVEPIEFRAEGL